MPSNKVSPYYALLLLAALASAQDAPSATSPPFPLDSNGEAHFNIPVVVKLADLKAGAAAQRRDESDAPPANAADAEPPQPAATFDESSAKVSLAPAAHIEPVFEVAHQGSEGPHVPVLEARDDPAPFATHTVLLVETTGTATSTVTEPCTDDAIANTTTAVDEAATGNLPLPLNHTSFPLRNGTNSSLPCNSTGWVKPAPAPAPGAAKPSVTGVLHNPANMAGGNTTKGFTGAASALVVSWSVMTAVAAFAAFAAF